MTKGITMDQISQWLVKRSIKLSWTIPGCTSVAGKMFDEIG